MNQQLNRVELCGTVGACRIQEVGGTRIARFTVATNYVYKAKDGTVVIETTWMTCVAFEKPETGPLDVIEKYAKIRLTGRIRNQRFTDSSGEERAQTEVLVSRFEILDREEPFLMQEQDKP